MASTIKIKNGLSGAPSSLAQGELAINIKNGSLFFGTENSLKSSLKRAGSTKFLKIGKAALDPVSNFPKLLGLSNPM